MGKTVTETAVEGQLHIGFRLMDPKQGGDMEDRLHAEVTVPYLRSDQPGNVLATTVVFKLGLQGPEVKGAQLVTHATGFHGDQAKHRLTVDERNTLVDLLRKLNDLGRECTGL